ncbi:acetylserotonin O-methyltransferase [Hyalangium gracile]|uniref:acetylserotonin O-methyltransferase n=1 Tax=Hyalangium gracile TaxID=394092 RepID=UPI001CCB788E|nr:acetylserotonin O-methyltransferase [Hyalangium gracile]
MTQPTQPIQPPAPTGVTTQVIQEQFSPTLPPHFLLANTVSGALLLSKHVWLSAELGIADHLAQGPRHIDELAAATATHAGSLYRVLRALASMGIFAMDEKQVFRNNPLSEYLRSDAPNSMRSYVRYFGGPWISEVYSRSIESVKTGKPVHELIDHANVFEVLSKKPELGRLFTEAMTGLAPFPDFALLKSYDFAGVRTLVDVAGGQGTLLAKILQAHPGLQGTLFDLPSVIQQARELGLLKEQERAGRAELVGGSFFEALPPGRDAYLFKQICHNWSDEDVVRMLKVARTAAGGPGKKLLILEMIIDPSPDKGMVSKVTDMIMLVQFGGRERTPQEFGALFEAAGFKLNRTIPTPTPYAIVEGVSV